MANLSTNQAATTLDLGGDLTVRRLGFGAMRITGPGIWGEPADHDDAIATLRRAVELGVNFVDTADSYGPFVSERLIAEALHPYPEDLVIATKGGMTRSGPGHTGLDGRPQHLRAACDESLQRLRLEQIPLYQFHRPDPNVPFEDSVGMLAELKNEGKVRHIGLSNVTETPTRPGDAAHADRVGAEPLQPGRPKLRSESPGRTAPVERGPSRKWPSGSPQPARRSSRPGGAVDVSARWWAGRW
jgi:aryl-alcohol dehydrogenase-like predicted oxidoreductase